MKPRKRKTVMGRFADETGLTYEQIARKAGLKVQTICALGSGISKQPHDTTLRFLALAFPGSVWDKMDTERRVANSLRAES